MNRTAVTKAAQHFSETGGIWVEEFQIALMICWQDIAAGHEQYFQLLTPEDKERALDDEAEEDDLIWGADRSLSTLLDSLDRRQRHKTSFLVSLQEIEQQERSKVRSERRHEIRKAAALE